MSQWKGGERGKPTGNNVARLGHIRAHQGQKRHRCSFLHHHSMRHRTCTKVTWMKNNVRSARLWGPQWIKWHHWWQKRLVRKIERWKSPIGKTASFVSNLRGREHHNCRHQPIRRQMRSSETPRCLQRSCKRGHLFTQGAYLPAVAVKGTVNVHLSPIHWNHSVLQGKKTIL